MATHTSLDCSSPGVPGTVLWESFIFTCSLLAQTNSTGLHNPVGLVGRGHHHCNWEAHRRWHHHSKNLNSTTKIPITLKYRKFTENPIANFQNYRGSMILLLGRYIELIASLISLWTYLQLLCPPSRLELRRSVGYILLCCSVCMVRHDEIPNV